jgi:hypothetical protein
VNPGGGAGWDEFPLGIQIPDDARELDRDVLAYHREQRAQRRRSRLRRLAGPLGGHGTVMPLLASILAVCLVAGAMLSVATFSPATAPGVRTHPATVAASSSRPVTSRTSPAPPTPSSQPATARPTTGRLPLRPTLRPKDPASTRDGKTATISSVPTGVNRGGRLR